LRLVKPPRQRIWLRAEIVALFALYLLLGLPEITRAQAPPPLTISLNQSQLPNAYYGGFYELDFTAAGGLSPYTWSTPTGLPPGTQFSFFQQFSTVSGALSALGTFRLTVGVTDSAGTKASQSYTITVVYPFTITSLSPPSTLRDAGGFVLVVNGNGFFDPSQATTTVRWNGSFSEYASSLYLAMTS
jgi:hypothetical protein